MLPLALTRFDPLVLTGFDPPSLIHRFAHAVIDAHLLEKLLDDEIDVSH
jgi:hypothetical protein